MQSVDRCNTDRRFARNYILVPLEVVQPEMGSRIEQRDRFGRAK